jgi:hypothetical protein
MRRNSHGLVMSALVLLGLSIAPESALAQPSSQPQDLGVVQAPSAGSVQIPLFLLPPHIRHSAEVAFKKYEAGATLTSAQLDKDDVLGVYEVQGQTADGRLIEADIRPDGVVEELEIQIGRGAVPEAVLQALEAFAPNFTPAQEQPRIEKSIRPSAVGLPEIWYEFSGTQFDVEVRSDGRAVLIEPA